VRHLTLFWMTQMIFLAPSALKLLARSPPHPGELARPAEVLLDAHRLEVVEAELNATTGLPGGSSGLDGRSHRVGLGQCQGDAVDLLSIALCTVGLSRPSGSLE